MTAITPTTLRSRTPSRGANIASLLVTSALSVVALWFLVAFLVVPNLQVLSTTFFPQQGSFWETVTDLATSERVRAALWSTLIVSVISVFTVTVVGVVQTFLIEGLQLRGRGFLTLAYAVPLVFGSVSAVAGYTAVYGRHGVVTAALQTLIPGLADDWFSGMGAVILVHTFTMTGYHFLFLRPALRRVDFSMVEAARSLGSSAIGAFVKIVLPALRPMLLASVLMVFISAAGSFAAPAILGGPGFTMLTPLVQALTGIGRTDMAAVLGLSLALLTGALLLWALREERVARVRSGSKSPRPFQRLRLRNRTASVLVHALAYLLAAINLIPVIITVLMSFTPPEQLRRGELGMGLTLANFAEIFSSPSAAEPILNSITLSAIAIPAALIIGTTTVLWARRLGGRIGDALQSLLFMPYFLPGVLVALGFLIAYGSPSLLVGGQVLVGSYLILPLAYMVLLLPTVARFVGAAMASLDPSLDEAARSLSAPAVRRFARITLPLLAPVLLQVAALGFNSLFDEYTVAVMLYNINNQPLGVTLGALAAAQDPELVGVTTAYVVITTALSLVVILFADRMAERSTRFESTRSRS